MVQFSLLASALALVSAVSAQCGSGTPAAKVTGSGSSFTATRGSTSVYTGSDYRAAIQAAVDSISSGQRVSVIASGSIGANTITITAGKIFEGCGTINVANRSGRGAIEVTDHHGIATLGRTYAERNRTLGPLRTDSVWTVVEIDPLRRRVDTGVGFAPLREVTSVFEFEPTRSADGREATRMTYRVEYVIGLGPIGLLLDRIQQPGMRANLRASMANLNTLIRSEALNTRA